MLLDGIHRGKEANRAIRGRQVAHLDKMKQHQAQTKMKLEEQQLKDKIIVVWPTRNQHPSRIHIFFSFAAKGSTACIEET